MCHPGVKSVEHYVCHCDALCEIRRYHCLLKEVFGPHTRKWNKKINNAWGFLSRTLGTERICPKDNKTTTISHQLKVITNSL